MERKGIFDFGRHRGRVEVGTGLLLGILGGCLILGLAFYFAINAMAAQSAAGTGNNGQGNGNGMNIQYGAEQNITLTFESSTNTTLYYPALSGVVIQSDGKIIPFTASASGSFNPVYVSIKTGSKGRIIVLDSASVNGDEFTYDLSKEETAFQFEVAEASTPVFLIRDQDKTNITANLLSGSYLYNPTSTAQGLGIGYYSYFLDMNNNVSQTEVHNMVIGVKSATKGHIAPAGISLAKIEGILGDAGFSDISEMECPADMVDALEVSTCYSVPTLKKKGNVRLQTGIDVKATCASADDVTFYATKLAYAQDVDGTYKQMVYNADGTLKAPFLGTILLNVTNP